MAISITNKTTGGDTDGNSTATTASVSWSTGDILLLTVNSRTGITADPNIPTPTTTGLTWTHATNYTNVYDFDSSSRKRNSLFYAIAGSSSSGTTGLDFGGQNQTNVAWVIDTATGCNTSTPVVQSAVNTDTEGGSITVTLSSFADATNNAAYGSFASDPGTGTMTNGTGFTELTDFNDTSIWTGTEWRTGEDTSVDATFDSVAGARTGGIAIELAIAVAASTTARRLTLLGAGS